LTCATVRAGVFFMRHMTQIVEDHQLRTNDVAGKTLTMLRRDELIPSTPENQRGHPERLELCHIAGVPLINPP
jgi:hypothetical protein